MAIGAPASRIVQSDRLVKEVNRGQAADQVLKLLDPLMEERLGQLLEEFSRCHPDLGPLLRLQAQIAEVWRIRRTLNNAKMTGFGAESEEGSGIVPYTIGVPSSFLFMLCSSGALSIIELYQLK